MTRLTRMFGGLIPIASLAILALAPSLKAATDQAIAGSRALTATGQESLEMFQEPLLVSGAYTALTMTLQNPGGTNEAKICSNTVACPPTCSHTCPDSCSVTCSINTCGTTCTQTCAGVTCGAPYNTCGRTVVIIQPNS